MVFFGALVYLDYMEGRGSIPRPAITVSPRSRPSREFRPPSLGCRGLFVVLLPSAVGPEKPAAADELEADCFARAIRVSKGDEWRQPAEGSR
jgi:hypothetical protein